MRRIGKLVLLALILAFLFALPILYLVALNFSIAQYEEAQPAGGHEDVPCDEEKPKSPWDDPEYWKNPWLI